MPLTERVAARTSLQQKRGKRILRSARSVSSEHRKVCRTDSNHVAHTLCWTNSTEMNGFSLDYGPKGTEKRFKMVSKQVVFTSIAARKIDICTSKPRASQVQSESQESDGQIQFQMCDVCHG